MIVSVCDWGIRCIRPDNTAEAVAWDDLQAVEVATNDAGPFVEDVFFILVGERGGCVVPQSARGSQELVARLVELPGFNSDAWAEAMSSTANARFQCWQRSRA